MSEHVLVRREGHVGIVTLNRPERRNALTMEMRARLAATLDEFADDPEVRVVVLQGTPPAFCAGVDLSEATSGAGTVPLDEQIPVGAPLAAFTKPLFASVEGAAAGGGFELALACDFIIASTTAQFLLPEVRIGSLPGGGGTQRLTRSIPRALAARMLYTGDAMDASTALASGLVTEVVMGQDLADRALELATRIASNAPLSLTAIKRCLQIASDAPLNEGLTLERRLWAQLALTEDRAEGRAAFREKRPPQFKGK